MRTVKLDHVLESMARGRKIGLFIKLDFFINDHLERSMRICRRQSTQYSFVEQCAVGHFPVVDDSLIVLFFSYPRTVFRNQPCISRRLSVRKEDLIVEHA